MPRDFKNQFSPTQREEGEHPSTTFMSAEIAVEKSEAKTRRVMLLITPSLYKKISKRATKEKISVNEFIRKAIEAAL